MRDVKILERDDVVLASDWCRPLNIVGESTRCCYSGQPENNARWVLVKHVIGPVWHDRPAGEINERIGPFEFVRGYIPVDNQLPLEGYNLLSDLFK